jgi:hypothetical protein
LVLELFANKGIGVQPERQQIRIDFLDTSSYMKSKSITT